jgi:hypothetical protein
MDDLSCIRLLTASFSKQLAWYEELSRIARKTLSQLVLSRGDMTTVMATVVRKNKIVEMIEEEREKVRETADYYRTRKGRMSAPKTDLDHLLATLESAIKAFLDGEDQLQRYLECMMEKGGIVTR